MSRINEQHLERRVAFSEGKWTKAGAAFNGVIALANVVVALLIYGQLDVLRGQLGEMKGSSKQMDEAIAAAKVSAAAAQTSANEAGATNKAQLRPWLDALVEESRNLNSDDFAKWTMLVFYKNVGKTPALDVDMYGAFEIHEYPLAPTTHIDLLDSSLDDPDVHTKIVILPCGEKRASVEFRADEVPKKLNKLKDGKYRLYALGHIRYFDIYGEWHRTQYCVAYSYEAITALRKKATTSLNGELCNDFRNAD